MSTVTVKLTVNGITKEVAVKPYETLLNVMRREFRALSVKSACLQGSCGLCTVLMNGRPVKSCMVLAAEADGANITTVEGVNTTVKTLQKKFMEKGALQCGFCTPAFVLVGHYLLEKYKRSLTWREVADGISGTICRCTGYKPIIEAIIDASKELYGE